MRDWTPYRSTQPCAVCGHKGGCVYKGPLESPTTVTCFRVAEGCAKDKHGHPITFKDGMGWVHDLRKEKPFRRILTSQNGSEKPKILPGIDKIAHEFSLAASQSDLHMWGQTLGVKAESLGRLSAGWCAERIDIVTGEVVPVGSVSFPMRDAHDRIIGIRLRNPDGRKWALPGSLNGLMIPRWLTFNGPLLIVEGPTESAAALDLGFDVIGRPGNTAGREHLVRYCRAHRRNVVIVRNNDTSGSDAERLTLMGANALAGDLAKLQFDVRIIWPPTVKDLRDWKNKAGATRSVIETSIGRTQKFIVPVIDQGLRTSRLAQR